ncbi:MAG: hypothetical protein RL711_370 [Bacteroidota bacterium]
MDLEGGFEYIIFIFEFRFYVLTNHLKFKIQNSKQKKRDPDNSCYRYD